MQNQPPPFRADTVGSLLRSKRLLEARAGEAGRRISDAELRKIEDEEVLRAVALQKDVGLKCCTDGDFRRRHWFMDFIERIDGLRFAEPMAVRFKSADGSVEFSPPRMELHAPLKRTQSLTGTDFPSLKPVADAAGLMAEGGDPVTDAAAFPQHPLARLQQDISRRRAALRGHRPGVSRGDRGALRQRLPLSADRRDQHPGHLSDPALREQAKKDGEDPDAWWCDTPS